jgi:hypothetical protein
MYNWKVNTAAWMCRTSSGDENRKPQVEESVGRPLPEAACVNVSGLSRVDCCRSQVTMWCARIVPNKWYEHKKVGFFDIAYDVTFTNCEVTAISINRRMGGMKLATTGPEALVWFGRRG